MTDYNDGNWHGWNGGKCPVHPKTVVDAVWAYDDGDTVRHRSELAASLGGRWVNGPGGIIAFRVVKEHREPREWWTLWSPRGTLIGNFTECGAHEKNDDYYGGRGEIIHIREVIE